MAALALTCLPASLPLANCRLRLVPGTGRGTSGKGGSRRPRGSSGARSSKGQQSPPPSDEEDEEEDDVDSMCTEEDEEAVAAAGALIAPTVAAAATDGRRLSPRHRAAAAALAAGQEAYGVGSIECSEQFAEAVHVPKRRRTEAELGWSGAFAALGLPAGGPSTGETPALWPKQDAGQVGVGVGVYSLC